MAGEDTPGIAMKICRRALHRRAPGGHGEMPQEKVAKALAMYYAAVLLCGKNKNQQGARRKIQQQSAHG